MAGVLGVAGLLKLRDPALFAQDIANYNLVPRTALWSLAYLLPPLELVSAAALFHPRYRPAGWLLCGGLFTLFAGAVASAVARGLDVSCGCFGSAMTVSWWHLAGNLVLAALCFWQFRQQTGPPGRPAFPLPHSAGEHRAPV